MNIDRFLFLFLVIGLLASCQPDEETVVSEPVVSTPKSYPGVNRELWIYFQRFEEEAKARGVIIDLNAEKITGVIDEISEDRVLGQCNFNPNRPNHLIIDKTFWASASEHFREFVVFHELGHCSLFREHREHTLHTGACASIMRSGKEDCRDNYSSTTRSFYLNELYDKAFFGDIFE